MTMWQKQILVRAAGIPPPRKKYGVTTHFQIFLSLNLERKCPRLLCILKLFRIMVTVALLYLKDTWSPTIFVFDSDSPC